MKSVCLLSHRPGSTPEAFRDYYESSHSRLGSRYFPFRKYVRNHVLSSVGDVDFDVFTEFYFDDDVDIAGVHSGRIREVLDEDERRFMNQKMIRSAAAEEILLAGSVRDIAPAGTRRHMLMLQHAGSSAGFREAANTWGKQLAADYGLPRVTADYTQSQVTSGQGAFPFAAVLSLWLPPRSEAPDELSAPAGIALQAAVLTEVCESTPELLRELYNPGVP